MGETNQTPSKLPHTHSLLLCTAPPFVLRPAKIANLGSHEVSKMCIADAISTDTLFITGGASVGEDDHEFDGCNSACGDPSMFDGPPGTSTVCDERCVTVEGRYDAKPSACGAGEASQLGRACRMCYTDRGAAVTAKKESPSSAVDDVIMCDTKRSPEAADCSSKCASSPHAVGATTFIDPCVEYYRNRLHDQQVFILRYNSACSLAHSVESIGIPNFSLVCLLKIEGRGAMSDADCCKYATEARHL